MQKTYSKEEFQAMISEVEHEFYSMLKSASEQVDAQLLAKSEEAPKEDEKKEEQSESKEEPQEEKKEESKEEDKKEDDESHGYDDEDMEEMRKMYSSMSKGELKAHKATLDKCYMEKCGDMTQMGKAEVSVKTEEKLEKSGVASEETVLLKSELENLKKHNQELSSKLEETSKVIAAMAKFVQQKAPARKAITNIDFVRKSEEESEKEKTLSKSEINQILSKKIQDPRLSSQDRAAINDFYLTNAGVEKIQHLLKQ